MKLEQLTKTCQELLYTNEETQIKLSQRLPSKEIQKIFQFGYFPTRDNLNILFSYIDEMELLDENIIYPDYNGNICSPLEKHNLVLPYKDVYGNIIAIVGRTLLTEEERNKQEIPKYKNTVFKKSKHLFCLYEAKNSIINKNYTYIVEGQFDAIQAYAKGIRNIVALGSSNMSFEQFALLLRYTNNIRLLLDNDEAGDAGREKIFRDYGKYANIINCRVPNGFKDFDEYLIEMKEIESEDIEAALLG